MKQLLALAKDLLEEEKKKDESQDKRAKARAALTDPRPPLKPSFDAQNTFVISDCLYCAIVQQNEQNPNFKKFAEKLDELRERMEQNLISSIDFLKQLLALAKANKHREKLSPTLY